DLLDDAYQPVYVFARTAEDDHAQVFQYFHLHRADQPFGFGRDGGLPWLERLAALRWHLTLRQCLAGSSPCPGSSTALWLGGLRLVALRRLSARLCLLCRRLEQLRHQVRRTGCLGPHGLAAFTDSALACLFQQRGYLEYLARCCRAQRNHLDLTCRLRGLRSFENGQQAGAPLGGGSLAVDRHLARQHVELDPQPFLGRDVERIHCHVAVGVGGRHELGAVQPLECFLHLDRRGAQLHDLPLPCGGR